MDIAAQPTSVQRLPDKMAQMDKHYLDHNDKVMRSYLQFLRVCENGLQCVL